MEPTPSPHPGTPGIPRQGLFSEGSARARERWPAKTRETRAAAREEKRKSLFFRASPVSPLK